MALFGTDGVRGVANVDLTAELVLDLAVAAAHVLGDIGEFAGHRPRAIVGNDSRASSDFLEAAVCAGLASAGIDVYLVGVLPTPAISYLVSSTGADLGVMISASHNPMPDNGIKFFSRTGNKLDDALEAKIEARLEESWDRPVGAEVGRVIDLTSARESYLSFLLGTIDTSFKGLKVVVDCANGAASFVAPEALRRAGADVIAIHATPNGVNINDHCGSTDLESLIETVKAESADIGIAHDGDADRVLAVDSLGNIVDGDHILGILAEHTALGTDSVVGTVMTNLGMIRALESKGINFIATPVGDRYVLEEMISGGHLLGGEQSGHIIMRKYASTGDGILTALHLISEIVRTGKSLEELANFMTSFPQVLINIKGVAKDQLRNNSRISEAVAEAEKTLGNKGRVLLRASGTEPLVRVMVEAEEASVAQALAQSLASLVKSELSL
jgi:phosphoglucosamine mutase